MSAGISDAGPAEAGNGAELGKAGTRNAWLQNVHDVVLPASWSGTASIFWQCGQMRFMAICTNQGWLHAEWPASGYS
jgi:hypothetical protein